MIFFTPEDDELRRQGLEAQKQAHEAKMAPFKDKARARLDDALAQVRADYRKGLTRSTISVGPNSSDSSASQITYYLSEMIMERTGLSCRSAGGFDLGTEYQVIVDLDQIPFS